MKRQKLLKSLLLFLLAQIIILAPQASAQNTKNKPFGLGIIAGDPYGASGKYWVDKTQAIDAFAGVDLDHSESFQLHADYLFHNFSMLNIKNNPVALYLGAGPKFVFDDDEHDGDTSFGLRFPLGLSYLFPRDPIELFSELAPALDIAPDSKFQLNWGLGVRFYFK